MKRIVICSMLFTTFLLSGCATRIIPYEVDRVDQEIKGNRGIVRGTSLEIPETKTKKTRKMYNLEIELFSASDVERLRKEDTLDKQEGNRGYLQRRVTTEKKSTLLKPYDIPKTPQVVYQKPIEPAKKVVKGDSVHQRIYEVKKGDTLQKISQNIYGTTKRWKNIYEANRNTLKNPDNIKVGQKLLIPED